MFHLTFILSYLKLIVSAPTFGQFLIEILFGHAIVDAEHIAIKIEKPGAKKKPQKLLPVVINEEIESDISINSDDY